MGLRTVFVARNRQARCAALRDGLLQCGRRLGWPTRTAIAFTEQLTRRPWKRCTPDQLSAVLDEMHAMQEAFEVRKAGPAAAMLAPALAPVRRGGRRASVD